MEKYVHTDKQILTSAFNETWYWYYESLFWPEQILRIREICDAAEEECAVTSGKTIDTRDEVIRKNKVSWHDNEELYSMLRPILHNVNKNSGWNYNITCIEPIQYTVYYGDNNHYSWHTDTIFNEKSQGILTDTIRKISCSIQLSDPDEYEGGEFEFLSGRNREYLEQNKDIFDLESIKLSHFKEKGSALFFPSNTYHRVKPVTKGIRRSLVCWFRGPNWV